MNARPFIRAVVAIVFYACIMGGRTSTQAQQSIWLYWRPPPMSTGITGFEVFWGPIDRSSTNLINTTYTNRTLITNLIYGQWYFFFLKSVAGPIESLPSYEVAYKSLPGPPSIILGHFLISGGPFYLEQSSNLLDWVRLYTNLLLYVDVPNTNAAAFYRLGTTGATLQLQYEP